jgi:hypothetical protein
VRPARKRELAAKVCDEWGVSIRRACSVLEFDRSTYHYKSRRREQAGIDSRIKEICQTRVRYGLPASGGVLVFPNRSAQANVLHVSLRAHRSGNAGSNG